MLYSGDMIELSEEMKTRLANALTDRCPLLAASVESDGYPKLSFYGSCQVFSKDQLAVWHRNPDSGLIPRLLTNNRMAFLYRHPTDRVSWQFFGRARVVTDPETRDQVYEAMPEIEKMLDKERKGQGVLVDLDRVTGAGVDMRREDS
jgi:hypothetical protein